jgi:hypothetical protein
MRIMGGEELNYFYNDLNLKNNFHNKKVEEGKLAQNKIVKT